MAAAFDSLLGRGVFVGLGHLLLAVLEPAERDGLGDLLALAHDDDLDLLADRHGGDEARQIAGLLDLLAVELDDHVACLQSRRLGGTLVVDARDQRAARAAQAQALRDAVIDRLDAHAEPAAPRLAELLAAAR